MKSIITFFFLLLSFGLFAQTFNWTEQQSGVSTSLDDVFFVDNQTGWVVGFNGIILHTSDGGNTWGPQQSGETQPIRAVHFIDASTGWAIGGTIPPFILKTTDGGANWTNLIPNASIDIPQDVFFLDENVGYLTTSDSIYRSTDGGENWAAEPYGSGIEGATSNRQVYAINDSIAFVCGRKDAPTLQTKATVFDRRPSTIPSVIWGSAGAQEFDANEQLLALTFASDLVGFTGGFGKTLYRMVSDGINYNGPWEKNLELDETNGLIQAISFPTAHSGMFNSSIQPDQVPHTLIYHTADGGDTWTSDPDTIPDFLTSSLNAPDSLNAWVVGNSGKIFHGTRLPVSIKEYENLVTFDVFPNPFEDNFTVNISLDQPEKLVVKLSNINGQKVYENNYDLGQGETSFELENLNKLGSGIYFLNVYSENGAFLASKKVVKF